MSIISCVKSHIKTLILGGNLVSHQIIQCSGYTPLKKMKLYKNLTINWPCDSLIQCKESFGWEGEKLRMMECNSSQFASILVGVLLKEIICPWVSKTSWSLMFGLEHNW